MQHNKATIGQFGFLLLVAIIVQAALGPAVADGLEDARRRGQFLAGVKTDFPPFGYLNNNGKYSGFDIEIARYFAAAFFHDERRVKLVPVTTGSRIPFLYSGWIDLVVATMTITDDRKRVLEFSEPYFVSGSLFLVTQSSSVNGLQDVGGKTVAVIEGSIQAQDLKQIAPQVELRSFATVSEVLPALKDGNVDAFCQDDVLVLKLAESDPDLKVVGKPFLPRPYAVAVRKGETEFITWINEQLANMKNDGTYQRLWEKYFGDIEGHLIKP
jgi:ABC-type amino acid transport substrate-binding protein